MNTGAWNQQTPEVLTTSCLFPIYGFLAGKLLPHFVLG